MKRISMLFVLAAVSISASAGVLKFSARHVIKPAAKVSAKVVKTGTHIAVKTAKVGKKVIY
jgi:hypothetical protein